MVSSRVVAAEEAMKCEAELRAVFAVVPAGVEAKAICVQSIRDP